MRYSVGGVRKVVPAARAPLRQRRHGRKPAREMPPRRPCPPFSFTMEKRRKRAAAPFFQYIILCKPSPVGKVSPTLWMFSHRENAARRFASRTALPQGKPKISRAALPQVYDREFCPQKSGFPCGKPLLLYFAQSFGVGGVSSPASSGTSVASRRAAASRAAFCRRSASSASRRRFASAFSASERFERSLRSASISS